jgi:hypothetical protein
MNSLKETGLTTKGLEALKERLTIWGCIRIWKRILKIYTDLSLYDGLGVLL